MGQTDLSTEFEIERTIIMKKILALLLSSLMLLFFTACGSSKGADLENALLAADACVEKVDSDFEYYIVDSNYDDINNIYTVDVYADEKEILSDLSEYQTHKYYDVLLHQAFKHYDEDSDSISTILSFLDLETKSAFEEYKTDTKVICRYITNDGSIVNYS